MNSNVSLLEYANICEGFLPLELTTARAGDAVSLKGYRRCLVVFYKGTGTAGDDPTITLEQGTNVAFGTNKALAFSEVYVKQGADLRAIGQWTKAAPTTANTYTHGDSAEEAALWAIDVKAEDLDIANDYDCIRASVGDVGTNAQLGALLYIPYDAVQLNKPESMASAIVD